MANVCIDGLKKKEEETKRFSSDTLANEARHRYNMTKKKEKEGRDEKRCCLNPERDEIVLVSFVCVSFVSSSYKIRSVSRNRIEIRGIFSVGIRNDNAGQPRVSLGGRVANESRRIDSIRFSEGGLNEQRGRKENRKRTPPFFAVWGEGAPLVLFPLSLFLWEPLWIIGTAPTNSWLQSSPFSLSYPFIPLYSFLGTFKIPLKQCNARPNREILCARRSRENDFRSLVFKHLLVNTHGWSSRFERKKSAKMPALCPILD